MSLARSDAHELVGSYRVLKAIGAGGSARIDLARIDRAYNFQRHVVIKRPLEHLRGDASVAASLRREAEIGGRLRHPNLVAVLDAGIHDGYDFLVLELVHGGTLRALMETETAGTVRDVGLSAALTIVVDAARGLQEAHELAGADGAPLGLVHRDVSPNNVLLGLDGTVKLSDFGIAKDTRVTTLSGSMRGTVTYMAPEQCRGHAFDRRADVFSLGVILYELTTGTRLFWADNDVASLHRVLSGTVPRPREVKPAIDPALEALILAALAHDPVQRLGSMRELADRLEAYAVRAGIPIGARWIASTMAESLGPRPSPWIAATTIVDVPQIRSGHSLVAVIEAAVVDEPVVAFGDAADRLIDEPATPVPVVDARRVAPAAAPVAAPATPREPHRPRTRLRALAVIGVLGAGIGGWLAVRPHDRGAVPVEGTHVPMPAATTPTPAAPTITPNADVVPAAGSASSQAPEIEMGPPAPGDPPTRPHDHPRPKAKATAKLKASASAPATAASPGAGSGSAAAHPAHVEWKPTMMLPSESGSGSKP